VTGDGGLIGARPAASAGSDRTFMLALLGAFALLGLACAGGLQALERRP
jgi:hypothetical protein